VDDETLETVRSLMVGAICVEMDNHGSFLHLIFGTCGLTIGAAWRLVHEGGIVVGSGTPEDVIDDLTQKFLGRSIEDVSIFGLFHDLRITFDADYVLDIFADSERYESWNLSGTENGIATSMIGAGPGDSWWFFEIPAGGSDASLSPKTAQPNRK
jgi:hypothetical protein